MRERSVPMTTREDLFSVLKDCIVAVIPTIARNQIAPDSTLNHLGADSIDRADIAVGLKKSLGFDVPVSELNKAVGIAVIVERLHARLERSPELPPKRPEAPRAAPEEVIVNSAKSSPAAT